MKLFARLFCRYAAHVGYLDGKRNFPGEQDFVEMQMHNLSAVWAHTSARRKTLLQIAQSRRLKDRR